MFLFVNACNTISHEIKFLVLLCDQCNWPILQKDGEIDNAKLRIRQLELERDAGREVYTRYFLFVLTKPYRNCEKNVKIKK